MSAKYASALLSVPAEVQKITVAERRENAYWACQRSLRIRPVGEGENVEAATKFMAEFLKLDDSFLNCITGLRAERIPFGPKTRYRNEMLLSFPTVDARTL